MTTLEILKCENQYAEGVVNGWAFPAERGEEYSYFALVKEDNKEDGEERREEM